MATTGKEKAKPTVKDLEQLLQQWGKLLLNKPYLESLTGDVRQLADDLLASKAIWTDEDGIIHSTISGSRRLKRYKKKLARLKLEKEKEKEGEANGSKSGD